MLVKAREGPNISGGKKVKARNLPVLALLKNAYLMFTSRPAEMGPHELETWFDMIKDFRYFLYVHQVYINNISKI